MIYIVYFSLKTLQLISDLILIMFFNTGGGFLLLIKIFIFILAAVVIGLLAKKFLPSSINKSGWFFWGPMIIIVLGSMINVHLFFIVLPALAIYALINIEAQTLHLLSKHGNISPLVASAVSLVPIGGLYFINCLTHKLSSFDRNISIAFYIVSFVFSLLGSYYYSNQEKIDPDEKLPDYVVFMGLFFVFFPSFLIILFSMIQL